MPSVRIPFMVSGLAELGDRLVVLFDGQCVLCNRTMRWFLRRDRRDRLRFAAFEAAGWGQVLARRGISLENVEAGPSTIFVVRGLGGGSEEILVRSDAALAILRELPRPWPAVAAAVRLIPRPIRDLVYRVVARLRNRIWGRLKICPLPTAEERDRFL
ncbi:MAG: DCC1-like thiol-disulfide oxidoreductase family protein [Terracidiphilus sp.]|jgi:predicted DCC family thiol-disulfide oxidoreductase YuxK